MTSETRLRAERKRYQLGDEAVRADEIYIGKWFTLQQADKFLHGDYEVVGGLYLIPKGTKKKESSKKPVFVSPFEFIGKV